jgi:pimeloyl-ACP methyl ester carboxylesterase
VLHRIATLLLVAALAAGCGGQARDRTHAAEADKPPAAPVTVDGPGRLVAIGGGRSLYLTCAGSGSPTVLLEAGAGGDTFNWSEVQPQLARTTRTCAYDRAVAGNSVAPPGVRDARDELGDLERLLAQTHIGPPYVLVGHSYGGVLVRVFADAHPEETAGMVLIDTMGRDGRRRQLAIWPRSQAPEIRAELALPVVGGVDLGVGEALASRVSTLGDTPLAVVTAGRQDNFPRDPARLAAAMRRLWERMQVELARLSGDSIHVVALRSDHDVPSSRSGQPSVIVRAVEAVVRAARTGTGLAPCSRVFRGPGVSCRG